MMKEIGSRPTETPRVIDIFQEAMKGLNEVITELESTPVADNPQDSPEPQPPKPEA